MVFNPSNKTIFFDAAGTLFDVHLGVGAQYSRMAAKYGVFCDPAMLDQRFREAFKKSPPLAFPGVGPEALANKEQEWWRNLVRDVFRDIPFPNFDCFFHALYSFFGGVYKKSDEPPWRCFPETVEVLEDLTQKGYPLGIISNFDSRLFAVLESLRIARFFQTMTVSGIEGVAKPSVEIFKRALAKAHSKPEDALYIGDTPDYDGIGATEAGIPFLLIARPQDNSALRIHPSPTEGRPSSDQPILRNLREVTLYL